MALRLKRSLAKEPRGGAERSGTLRLSIGGGDTITLTKLAVPVQPQDVG